MSWMGTGVLYFGIVVVLIMIVKLMDKFLRPLIPGSEHAGESQAPLNPLDAFISEDLSCFQDSETVQAVSFSAGESCGAAEVGALALVNAALEAAGHAVQATAESLGES